MGVFGEAYWQAYGDVYGVVGLPRFEISFSANGESTDGELSATSAESTLLVTVASCGLDVTTMAGELSATSTASGLAVTTTEIE